MNYRVFLMMTMLGFFAKSSNAGEPTAVVHVGAFGTCCKDLKDALDVAGHSMFRVEENGVLYLSVGYVDTKQGPGWFDQAVIFCPFCGKQLQTREEIQKKTKQN